MQVASTKEEWNSRGIKLFNEGNFEMATMCFESGGDSYREKWARAAGLQASSDRLRGSNSEHARIALIQAAGIYEEINKAELAAKCFIDLKESERAGMLYLDKCGETRLEEAGDCFSLAKCWSLAAEAYARGKYLSKCLSICKAGELFDIGLKYIKHWKENDSQTDGVVNKSQLEFEENTSEQSSCPEALVISLNQIQCREETVGIPFPKNVGSSKVLEEASGVEIERFNTSSSSHIIDGAGTTYSNDLDAIEVHDLETRRRCDLDFKVNYAIELQTSAEDSETGKHTYTPKMKTCEFFKH